MTSVKEILDRYSKKIEEKIEVDNYKPSEDFSREYETFREEALDKQTTLYEKACNASQNLLTVSVNQEQRAKLQESIDICHLDIKPEGAASFASIVGISFVLLGILFGAASYVFGSLQIFFPLILVILGAFMIKPLTNLPHYFANRWRLEASNQMVLCILYVVMYMRHTSNLEHAIKFAAEHVGNPLGLDLKKVFWNIETGKFVTIEESLENYLLQWKQYNLEFVEAFHLIEGSLYETNEQRRVDVLEKALEVMLEGTYDKMLHYAHNLQNPITMLHMLGVILPVLGLVMFPLIGSFLSGLVKWYHLALLYNVLLPVFILILGNKILEKRPTGYGKSDFLNSSEEFKRIENENDPRYFLVPLAIIFFAISFLPFLMHFFYPSFDFEFFGSNFFDFRNGSGPYGLGALLLSLIFPLGLAVCIGLYYKIRTKKLIVLRENMDSLEKEFSGALFLLGNRVEDGLPVEIAFSKVAENMEGTETGNFFRRISINIRKLGLSLYDAIFSKQVGVANDYPSPLIESSMKVLVEGAKKGPKVVAKSLITISTYVDKIKKVNERLIDLLADVISSMKSQISFLTPVIAGIVVGVSSMVVSIIAKLGEQFSNLEAGSASEFGGLATIANILKIQDVIPSYQFQMVVGFYVLEITIILIILSSAIERGIDKLQARYQIGKSLIMSMVLYFVISLVGILLFNTLANAINLSSAT
ncbi:MAG TPA: hypothetical protein VJB94_03100 [Candidatus Nanoarchaeia archaeon]|nr:hypothetical protein [Candidatus Nanoarchaeia archaeon]